MSLCEYYALSYIVYIHCSEDEVVLILGKRFASTWKTLEAMVYPRGSDYLALVRNRRFRALPRGVTDLGFANSESRNIDSRFFRSSRFILSIMVTFFIIIVQFFLVIYYINQYRVDLQGDSDDNYTPDWDCSYPGLKEIYHAAQRSGVELVVVDPDLLEELEQTSNPRKGFKSRPRLSFEQRRSGQDFSHKTIVHLAAINETSGGQPSLKLFVNELKSSGYAMLKYDDTSQLMPPEAYKRDRHQLDDMLEDDINGHKESHDLKSAHLYDSEKISHQNEQFYKIYTEFLTHLFVLNYTHPTELYLKERKLCKEKGAQDLSVVIHIMVLYNYDFDPSNQWIQPDLVFSEIDKHKLLSYNVHSVDFRISLKHHYLHPKRLTVSVIKPTRFLDHRNRSPERVRVFEPIEDRLLRYVNNSYVHCQPAQFKIGELLDNRKHYSKYLRLLDESTPLREEEVQVQLRTALRFMEIFSGSYNNFSFWLTGSTLLAYHKYCQLALCTACNMTNPDSNEWTIYLEFGLLLNELDATMIRDLANANTIGVNMLSEWKDSNALISFRLQDSPNLVIDMHPYELRKDFYEYYYITRSTMTSNIRFGRKSKAKKRSLQLAGHHVFSTSNLELCWTKLHGFSPFRVPCETHDHLRRIYVI